MNISKLLIFSNIYYFYMQKFTLIQINFIP